MALCYPKGTLDELLCNYTILEDVLSCNNLFGEDHSVIIDSRHEHFVKSLITAAQQHIPFTQPYSEPSRTHPGWNDFVKSFPSEALDWHQSGSDLVDLKVDLFTICDVQHVRHIINKWILCLNVRIK